MSQSVANAANLAMRVYDSVIAEQVFKKNVLWMNILKNVATKKGTTEKYLKVHYGRNIGSAAGGETLTLPGAGRQSYLESVIPMKLNFHQIQLTDYAIQAGKNSKEYLVDLLQGEYEGAKNDMQRQLSRQGYGDGSGVICKIDGVDNAPTYDLKDPMVGKNAADYFEAGAAGVGNNIMMSDQPRTGGTTAFDRIDAIPGPNQITLATSSGTDDHYVFLAHYNPSGASTVSNRDAEITGLKALIDDGENLVTLQNLSRTTYIWWKSYANDSATSRSLTEEIMFDTMLEAKKKGNPKLILTSYDLFGAYGRLLAADRRYTDTMELKGGFTGVKYNDLALVPDYDAPYKDMFFIDKETLSVEELTPMSFMDSDGNILSRSATTPAFSATLRYYSNLATSAPNRNAVARNLVA